ncbi:carbohydrate-binding-like protein [Panaeolus papilionaceus]|nr:carbohydrate-binding-like protein [Panaeolus papilionaceus]
MDLPSKHAKNPTVQSTEAEETVVVVSRPGSGPGVLTIFNVQANAVWGESIYLTGSVRGWSPSNAIDLSSAHYPIWTVTVDIPPNNQFEDKFIRKNGDSVTWESDPNRIRTSPASGSLTINDGWR